MPLTSLDHCSIRTVKLEETKDFYTDALGLSIGDRPDFPFPGYWLYLGDTPVVHLVGIDPDDPQGLVDYLGEVDIDSLEGTGSFDHAAFTASDAPERIGVEILGFLELRRTDRAILLLAPHYPSKRRLQCQ